MALLTEATANPNLVPAEEWHSRKRDKAKERNDEVALTPEEEEQLKTVRYCIKMLEEGIRARRPYETFDQCWASYIGDYWPSKRPAWKAAITVNKVRAFIHFMQAVMTDNKPRFQVAPLIQGSANAAGLLQKLSDRDWDENRMQKKTALAVLFGLIWGTGFIKATYNPMADGGRGRHEAFAVPPYRIYTNRTATSVDDESCRFIIHVEDQPLGWVYDNYPEKASVVSRYKGARVGADARENARDFILEGTEKAGEPIESAINTGQQVVPPEQMHRKTGIDQYDDHETIEVAEFWFRDETEEEYERQVIKDGVPQMEDAPDDENGLPQLEVIRWEPGLSPVDGMPVHVPVVGKKRVPVMEKACRKKFPGGRLIIMAGPVVLRDIPNPFQIDGFPFAQWKDQDVGAFFGQGEPPALREMNIALNRTASQISVNLEHMGNVSLIVRKGSGINPRQLKNKPGSIIPVEDDINNSIKQLEVKPVSEAFISFYELIETAMMRVAGLNDAFMGGISASNTAFATVDQLAEQAAAPIRQKVRNMEEMITRYGKLRIQLIQQWDEGKRPLRERIDNQQPEPVMGPDGEVEVIQPAPQVEYQFREYTNADLQGQVEFQVIPDSSLATSPAGVFNRYMTLYDKHLVDRQAVHEKLRIDDSRAILARMAAQDAAAAQMKGFKGGRGKPGPPPSRPARATPKKPGPVSQLPSRLANASVR